MRKWLGVIALLAAFGWALLGSAAAEIDGQKVIESPGVKEAGEVSCGRGVVVPRFLAKADGLVFLILLNPESKKMVIVKADATGEPLEVAFGRLALRVDSEQRKLVVFEQEALMTAEEATVRFPSPCNFLAPDEA
jgi:hypothetical protein